MRDARERHGYDPPPEIRAEINVTPLVDVVLVLLIIFMVLTPFSQMGYLSRIPPPAKDGAGPPDEALIVRMTSTGELFINRECVPASAFPERLRAVLAGRRGEVTFVAASGDVAFERVLGLMDACRSAGADKLGVVLEELGGS